MKNFNKKRILIFLAISFGIPFLLFAKPSGLEHGIDNPYKEGGDLKSLIKLSISAILKLAIPFLVLAYIWVGFLFVKAQGNADELKKVKKAFIWLIVGTALIVGANSIYSLIYDTVKQIKY